MRIRRATGVLFAVLVAAGFILTAWGSAGLATRPATALGALAPTTAPSFPTPIRHVFVLMFENTELGDAMRNGSYERYLASHYSFAGQYYSLEHYSLPNYLAVTSGTPTNLFQVENVTNLADLLGTAGLTWKGEEESMPHACDSVDSGGYDHFHDPWVMYGDLVNRPTRCASHVVNFTALNSSQSSGVYPNYNLVVPNRTHDGHDTNASVADSWLRSFLSPLVNASIFRTSVFFITYDEGTTNLGESNSTTGGGHVYFAAVSPYSITGFNSTQQYSDYNVLTTTEWLLGLGHTGHHDNWATYPPMKDLFT
ncbi:MAG: alkaline phosphatase family protein [Thermoplasmata archaeon]|nr:alkaline phosphatase family protein [Thermoplasmata archaeon]MCI4356027.1 alkaline phosphatase family protein [Thermoplasmata archaeon]